MAALSSKYHWFFRYKLYHLPFWLAYHLTWWTITIGSFSGVIDNIGYTPYFLKTLFYVIFQAIGVYFNLYFLIPRFLEKGKYVQYLILVILTIVCMAFLIVTGYYISAWAYGKTVRDLYNVDPANFLFFFQVNTLPSSVASMTLGMSVKLTKNWIQSRRREQTLEKEKLETELKFLKSQFNPHFLFNTINSIFVLIHKNPNMASDSLAKFSDLLRYQLYECNEQQIPLDKEVAYMKNFIELERLRQDHCLELNVQIDEPLPGNRMVAPFVLMPFVENAFKHVSRGKDRPNRIEMRLSFVRHDLLFNVTNTTSAGRHSADALNGYKGIGLRNVQRRLDLIYPDNHELKIQAREDQFSIMLRLRLFETSAGPLVKT